MSYTTYSTTQNKLTGIKRPHNFNLKHVPVYRALNEIQGRTPSFISSQFAVSFTTSVSFLQISTNTNDWTEVAFVKCAWPQLMSFTPRSFKDSWSTEIAVTGCEVLTYTVRIQVGRKLFCSRHVVIRLPLLPSDCFLTHRLLLAFYVTRK